MPPKRQRGQVRNVQGDSELRYGVGQRVCVGVRVARQLSVCHDCPGYHVRRFALYCRGLTPAVSWHSARCERRRCERKRGRSPGRCVRRARRASTPQRSARRLIRVACSPVRCVSCDQRHGCGVRASGPGDDLRGTRERTTLHNEYRGGPTPMHAPRLGTLQAVRQDHSAQQGRQAARRRRTHRLHVGAEEPAHSAQRGGCGGRRGGLRQKGSAVARRGKLHGSPWGSCTAAAHPGRQAARRRSREARGGCRAAGAADGPW